MGNSSSTANELALNLSSNNPKSNNIQNEIIQNSENTEVEIPPECPMYIGDSKSKVTQRDFYFFC